MAIGIGANAAMFSLVDAVLLKPLPYPDPDRIVRVMEQPTSDDAQWDHARSTCSTGSVSSTSFEALSATRGLSVAVTGDGEPTRLSELLVSADYFRVFGVEAAMGRTFRAERRGARRRRRSWC